ncbi:RNA polymerase III subunit RPC82-domain-containing protein [Flammula alnicola]|nr:RNA polymerase III subunit RPC82-domain-containing protein [Flammula alnicola]
MADNHTRRLCVEIIHSHFGPLTAKLASVLLIRGRLPLSQLIRFSQLKPRTARASILVLVQHNIVWHTKGDDDVEVFEVNVDECLMRMRFGRFIWLAEQIFGKPAADIVQLILDHGKLRTSDILSMLSVSDAKSTSFIPQMTQYNQILFKLVSGSYLKPSTVLSHLSPRDKCIQYEAEEKRKIVGFPTAKELREAKEIAQARLKREEEEAEQVGLKRKAKDQLTSRTNKRKLSDEDVVNDFVYFKINYEKFSVHIRNTVIENAAKDRFNHGASLVMKAAMKATESTQLNISEPRSVPISVANIVMQIPEDANLTAGLVYPSKKVGNLTCVKDYLGMLSSADNPTPEGRASSFLSYSTSKVQVEFEIIARKLRQNIVESVARSKHGPEGVRILRLLSHTGKMDEKQISKNIMMAAKDVRPLLVALSADSLICTQEVPKSADRNPARTFYLWYVDFQKAYSMILGNLYKTLYNIMARRRAECEYSEVAAVLEKRQRSDVSQDENLLTRLEREVLKGWEEKQEKLAVIEMRVEEIVFLLKDLGPLCVNYD